MHRLRAMLPTLGLLKSVRCPDRGCERTPCLFSHDGTPQRSSEPPAKRSRLEAPASPVASTSKAAPTAPAPSRAAPAPARKPQPPSLTITNSLTTHTPAPTRNQLVSAYWLEFRRIYARLPPDKLTALSAKDALEQERVVYTASSKATYRNNAAQALAKLKKRAPVSGDDEGGTNETVTRRTDAQKAEAQRRVRAAQVLHLVMGRAQAEKLPEYVIAVPSGEGGTEPDQLGKIRECIRCKGAFEVRKLVTRDDHEACKHHWGRYRPGRNAEWTCCRTLTPCTASPHVFRDDDPAVLHRRLAFATTASISTATHPFEVVALDCELVQTTAGLVLARLTVIDGATRAVVLDEYVRTQGSLLDPVTRFSGIKREDLEGPTSKAVLDTVAVRKALGALIGPETIIVGHGLENDLRAMRLVHPPERLIDTVIHPKGLPYRRALRDLSKEFLQVFVQDQGTHDSAVDASVALDLVILKAKR